MNDEQREKLKRLKDKNPSKSIKLVTNEDLNKLNLEHKSDFETFSKSVIKSIEDLAEALNVNVEINDLSPLNEKLEKLADLPDSFVTIKELSAKIHTELTRDKEVSIKGFRDLWEMLVRQNNQLDKNTDKKLTEVVEKFTDLRVYLDQLTETLKQGQDPNDFRPVRLVIGGDGVPLQFLKNMPSSRGGGGGSSSGGSSDASAAKQDEQTALLTTIDADTGNLAAIKTAIEILDNIVSGSEAQVDIVGSLPAGTNAIGKLAANSGVDIGDVDVTSLPRSQSGPGQPGTAIDSYTHAAINLAAGANQVLVSSAANKQIWVYGIGFSVNAAGTVSFQDEDDIAITGIMTFATNSGMAVPPSGNFSMPIWKLGTDKDLEVDIVTSELDGWIDYAIVSV